VSEATPVELRQITPDNFDDVIALRVADDQRDYLPPVVEMLAWAHVASECRPFAIYSGDTPVGFAMYGYIPADGRCWVNGFMVDERHQRRGIGRAALEQLLAKMTAESGGANLLLSVHPDNTRAMLLYESFGFRDTGKRQNGEAIMRRPAVSM
jgi:diamine N-acetyltransferase